jgi:hypothetical protein
MDKSGPLVTCILPTRDRRRLVEQAITYFRRQDYPERELIIVDDGDDPVADLAAGAPRIRYIRLHYRASRGAKRNLACGMANGSVIVHWNENDWMADWRISYQVTHLLQQGADICGSGEQFYYDLASGQGWQYLYPPRGHSPRVAGNSLCYTKSFWQTNPFPDHNTGEELHFLSSNRPKHISILPRTYFVITLLSRENSVTNQGNGSWHPFPAATLRNWMGEDLNFYPSQVSKAPALREKLQRAIPLSINASPDHTLQASNSIFPPRTRNVFACLVHEEQNSVIDLVRNLRYFDPSSQILLYNGGEDLQLLKTGIPLQSDDVIIHPNPRRLKWGRLHDFALDCMRFALENIPFDTFTIVDSDQLAVRSNYSDFLAAFLVGKKDVGVLSSTPHRQTANSPILPVRNAHKEIGLWRPFLRRFLQGEDKYVYWSFWPSTVFTADAARELTKLFSIDTQLQDIMNSTRIWASEEIILPTVVALLGFEVAAHPCSFEYVKYRETYSRQQVDAAISQTKVYWIHPIPRHYEDEVRKHIRTRFNQFERM